MEYIEKYIQFAIDNGFILDWEIKIENNMFSENNIRVKGGNLIIRQQELIFIYPISELITSKPFIEAIARGLWNKAPYWKSKWYMVKMVFPIIWQLNYGEQEGLFEDLTIFQAIAIRDGTLEQFIENLLPKQ